MTRAAPALALLGLLLPSVALADEAYESSIVRWGLAQHGRVLEPSPEGKEVEEVLVASEDIISASDPYPNLLNWLHVKTREPVVRREVLLEVGRPYRPFDAEQTERNLRATALFSVARVVAVKGSREDRVGVLVITKDLWSLRFNSAYNLVGALFLYLRLRPTEQNFLGLGKAVTLDYVLERGSVSFGQIYTDPRLFGSRLLLQESAALIFNRNSWALEGSRGSVLLARPFYSLETTWGFSVSGEWNVRPFRRFVGADVEALPFTRADGASTTLLNQFDATELGGLARYRRAFGTRWRTYVDFGYGLYDLWYRPLPGLTAEERAWYTENHLPRSERAGYLQVSARTFDARYAILRDRDTFALSEDYQLGHSLWARLRFAHPAFLSRALFWEGLGAARYRWLAADNLVTANVVAGVRYVPGATGEGTQSAWVNRRLAAEVEELTPLLGIGRIAFRALLDLRFANLNREPSRLGGGNGLRGLPAEALRGEHLVLFNLEYRTVAWNFKTLHLGLVFFYDAGSAFITRPQLVHSLGVGLRALFPQFDREPFRLDFGWVINPPVVGGPLDCFSASFGQVTRFEPDYLDRHED